MRHLKIFVSLIYFCALQTSFSNSAGANEGVLSGQSVASEIWFKAKAFKTPLSLLNSVRSQISQEGYSYLKAKIANGTFKLSKLNESTIAIEDGKKIVSIEFLSTPGQFKLNGKDFAIQASTTPDEIWGMISSRLPSESARSSLISLFIPEAQAIGGWAVALGVAATMVYMARGYIYSSACDDTKALDSALKECRAFPKNSEELSSSTNEIQTKIKVGFTTSGNKYFVPIKTDQSKCIKNPQWIELRNCYSRVYSLMSDEYAMQIPTNVRAYFDKLSKSETASSSNSNTSN